MLLFLVACAPDTNFVPQEDTDVKTVYPDGVPDIFIEQEMIDFGTITETGEAHRPLTITNIGGGRLNVHEITVRQSRAIAIDANDDFLLDASETLELSLVWTPGGEWPLSSTLEVKSNDPNERIVEIPCEGAIAE